MYKVLASISEMTSITTPLNLLNYHNNRHKSDHNWEIMRIFVSWKSKTPSASDGREEHTDNQFNTERKQS